MNIKVLATVLILGIATTLGACGGGGSDAPTSPGGSASPSASPSK